MLSGLAWVGLVVFSILVALIANWAHFPADKRISSSSWSEHDISNIVAAWERDIKEPIHGRFTRITIGFNANVDLITNGVSALKLLAINPSDQPVDHPSLENIADFEQAFLHSLHSGSASERPFQNEEHFKKLLKAATNITEKQWFIGGNAGLMAQKIVTTFPNVEVHLVAPIGSKLTELFHESIRYPDAVKREADEVHLIMEYGRGEKWGSYTSDIANRFITSYDLTNSQLLLMDDLFENVHSVKPNLLIISGLHMLESQLPDFRSKRLDELRAHLQSLSKSIIVHLELASMADKSFIKEICTKVLQFVTSLGLNEQELSFTMSALDKNGNLGDGKHPEINRVTEMMNNIMEEFGFDKDRRPENRLTRVHFHSLTFHVIAALYPWSNLDSAVSAGTRIAGQQACDSQSIDASKVELRLPHRQLKMSPNKEISFDSDHPVSLWNEGQTQFAFSPVLVCKVPLKTVGLGDAISATGLMYSDYVISN